MNISKLYRVNNATRTKALASIGSARKAEPKERRVCPPGPLPYAPRDVDTVHWKGTPFKRQLKRWKSDFVERESAKKFAADSALAEHKARHANCRGFCVDSY